MVPQVWSYTSRPPTGHQVTAGGDTCVPHKGKPSLPLLTTTPPFLQEALLPYPLPCSLAPGDQGSSSPQVPALYPHTIQKRVPVARVAYCSMVDSTLKMRQMSTMRKLQETGCRSVHGCHARPREPTPSLPPQPPGQTSSWPPTFSPAHCRYEVTGAAVSRGVVSTESKWQALQAPITGTERSRFTQPRE